MARVNITQQNFNTGELSPKMHSRYDLAAYYNGAERMENFIPQIQGPAKFRNGFFYVTTTPEGNTPTLVPFVFNNNDAYMLEFTNNRLRFYRNSQIVKFVDGDSIEALEKRTNRVVVHVDGTNTSTTFHTNNTVSFAGITLDGYEFLNNKTWVVDSINTSTFNASYIELLIVESGATAEAAQAASGFADSHVTVTTSLTTADLETLQFKQTFDAMYLVNGSEVVYKLTRTSNTSWSIGANTTTGVTFTGSGNFPAAVEIYENRLWHANTANDPFKFWGSVTDDFTAFDTSASDDDDDYVEFTISADQNDILHLRAYQDFLIALTLGGAFRITGATQLERITASNINVRPIHYIGSSTVPPIQKDNDLIFVERGNLKLRQIVYSFERDRYEPQDLTKMADHIAGSGFEKIAYQQGIIETIWAKANGGQLRGFTYDPDENVKGWHRHTIGDDPTNDVDEREGLLLDIATVPRANLDSQLWYAAVQGDETVVGYLEDERVFPRFEDYYTGNESEDLKRWRGELYYQQQRSIHLDAAVIYNGSLTASSVILTLGARTGKNVLVSAGSSIFQAGDVGREIRGQTTAGASHINGFSSLSGSEGIPYGRATIVEYVSGTQVRVDITEDFEKDYLGGGSVGNGTLTGEDEWYLTAGTIAGLGHLANQTVSVIADGETHPNVEVNSAGELTLVRQAAYAIIGYPYTGVIKSVDVEAGGTLGPAQTKLRNVAKCGVKFMDTVSCKVGSDIYNLEQLVFKTTDQLINRAIEAFTGEKIVHFPSNWEREKHIWVVQDEAVPCTVMLLNPYVDTSND